MRALISILLFVSLVFPFLLKLGIVGNYYLNKTYYATVLCVNKDNKNLDCEGSCQLTKELAITESEKRPESPQAPKEIGAEISPFVFQEAGFMPHPAVVDISIGLAHTTLRIKHISFSIFHPPQYV